MIKENKFIHLHCHDQFSVGDSISSVKDIMKTVALHEQKAICITNHGSMFSMVEAYLAAKKHNIKWIPGMEPYFSLVPIKEKVRRRYHITLLAYNQVGLTNLIKLNNIANTKGFYYYPRIDMECLKSHANGLIVLSGCYSGVLAQFSWELFKYDNLHKIKLTPEELGLEPKKYYIDGREKYITDLKNTFGDRLYIELQDGKIYQNVGSYKDITVQTVMTKEARKIAKKFDIQCVATQDSHYINKEDAYAHEVFLAIGTGKKMSVPPYSANNPKGRKAFSSHQFWIQSQEELSNIFTDEEIENTSKIADMVEVDIPIGTPKIPKFTKVPEGVTPLQYLKKLCYETYLEYNLDKKDNTQEYINRMKYELAVIEEANLIDYFLINHDWINHCHENKIPLGPARGCLTGETLVLTKNGYKELKDINIGDYVYTHTGDQQKVLEVFKYNINETLIEIKTDYSYKNIILTKDHKVYGISRKETQQYQDKKNDVNYKSLKKIKRWEDIDKRHLSWIRGEDLKCGDVLYMPKVTKGQTKILENIDLAMFSKTNKYNDTYIKRTKPLKNIFSIRKIARDLKICRSTVKRIKQKKCIKNNDNIKKVEQYLNKINSNLIKWRGNKNEKVELIKRYIKQDKEFYYLLGRWIGDGWYVRTHGVGLAFNSNDIAGIERIEKYLNLIGFKCHLIKAKNKNLIQMMIYGDILYNLIKSIVVDYKKSSFTKHLPINFRELPDSLLKSLLFGLQDSDGHINYKENKEHVDTTSLRLALEVKEALLYLNIPSGVSIRPPYKHGEYNCRQSYKISFKGFVLDRKDNTKTSNGYFCPIKKINNRNDINSVYDIMVEGDTSYLTANYAVHNSCAGSCVAWLLKITSRELDPLKYNLIFERFYNRGRAKKIKYDYKEYSRENFEEQNHD